MYAQKVSGENQEEVIGALFAQPAGPAMMIQLKMLMIAYANVSRERRGGCRCEKDHIHQPKLPQVAAKYHYTD